MNRETVRRYVRVLACCALSVSLSTAACSRNSTPESRGFFDAAFVGSEKNYNQKLRVIVSQRAASSSLSNLRAEMVAAGAICRNDGSEIACEYQHDAFLSEKICLICAERRARSFRATIELTRESRKRLGILVCVRLLQASADGSIQTRSIPDDKNCSQKSFVAGIE